MRKLRKKFKKPRVSWDSDLIKENKKLSEEYGLRRRKEILIAHEILRGFRQRARHLIAEHDEVKERILLEKLVRAGLLTGTDKELDDILALTIRNVLDRRLQTMVFRKGVATSPIHARQLIVHGHVKISGRKVKFPSYLVSVDEENAIEIVISKPGAKKNVEGKAKTEAEGQGEERVEAAGKVEEKSEMKQEVQEGQGKESEPDADKKGDS